MITDILNSQTYFIVYPQHSMQLDDAIAQQIPYHFDTVSPAICKCHQSLGHVPVSVCLVFCPGSVASCAGSDRLTDVMQGGQGPG